jgi:ribulose bisphosphate carboxylase small subunit
MEEEQNLKKKSFLAKLSDGIMKSIKSFDEYGNPIALTYDRETEFKTHFGGFCTLLLKIAF